MYKIDDELCKPYHELLNKTRNMNDFNLKEDKLYANSAPHAKEVKSEKREFILNESKLKDLASIDR